MPRGEWEGHTLTRLPVDAHADRSLSPCSRSSTFPSTRLGKSSETRRILKSRCCPKGWSLVVSDEPQACENPKSHSVLHCDHTGPGHLLPILWIPDLHSLPPLFQKPCLECPSAGPKIDLRPLSSVRPPSMRTGLVMLLWNCLPASLPIHLLAP